MSALGSHLKYVSSSFHVEHAKDTAGLSANQIVQFIPISQLFIILFSDVMSYILCPKHLRSQRATFFSTNTKKMIFRNLVRVELREGNGTPLQYSCLENPMDGGALVDCSPWSQTWQRLHFYFSLSCIGEGNGNPLQCSCLENPRDGGAWWAAVYGVAQSQTWLKQLSSSSIKGRTTRSVLRYNIIKCIDVNIVFWIIFSLIESEIFYSRSHCS